MDTSRERDQSVDQLLRRALRATGEGDVTGACLDAETLAAWVDGSLPRPALEPVEIHVADCARCQSLLAAMARTDAAVPEPQPEPQPELAPARRRWLGWLVPLTAAAAAAVLWIAVPTDSGPPALPALPGPGPTLDTATAEPAARPEIVPLDQAPSPAVENDRLAATATARPIEPQPLAQAAAGGAPRADANRTEQRETAAAPPAAAPPAAAPIASFEAKAEVARPGNRPAPPSGLLSIVPSAAPIDIVSPDPSVLWRITGALVERSTDAGASWRPAATDVRSALTAGSAPSTSVCWLVGRFGVVLLTVDGTTWRRVIFPEITDLLAIRAVDGRSASISTADGRVLSTSDGGATWSR